MLTRHDFLRLVVTSVGGGALLACGDPEPPPDAPVGSGSDAALPADAFMGTCETNSVAIGANHGHEMTVEPADLDSTSPKDYAIQGVADHPHSVTITPAQFATLRAEGSVMVTSTLNYGHSHAIRVRCTA